MNTPGDSGEARLDALAAATTVKDYGDLSIVTIPEVSTLSELQRNVVLAKAQQQYSSTDKYKEALVSRLQCMTPPPDEEEELEECRVLEAEARKILENEGCPPCYPPDLAIPLKTPPETYQTIIHYWQSDSSTDGVVLCAELKDWRQFRGAQRRDRARYRNKPFKNLVDEVCERRRRHGLDGDVHLLFDLERQEPLGNWLEYQNYSLKRLERFERDRDELKNKLAYLQKNSEDAATSIPEKAAWDLEAFRRLLNHAEWELDRHKILLHWIEQQRLLMMKKHPTSSRRRTPPKPSQQAPKGLKTRSGRTSKPPVRWAPY